MILTVTINPLLERRFYFDKVFPGKENRNGIEVLKAGGKGINISRQLNNLKVENLAFTFLGGINGKTLKDILAKENIKIVSVRTDSETRESAIIVDKSQNTISTYFSQNSIITQKEVEEFKSKLEKMIQNCEIVIFSGSSPCRETDSIFPFGIEIARENDKISFCDTYGSHLQHCINAGPTVLHNNITETEKSLKIDLDSENSKIKYLTELYSKNIKQTFLTDGANDSFCSNFDYFYKIKNPTVDIIDSTGSGDSFTAGIAYCWHNNLTFEESLVYASSLGLANALEYETSNVSPTEMEKHKKNIIIEPIGKKMKTLDVTPR